jgi:hypothetical protein
MPSKKEGNRSPSERSFGLKAIKVATLNKVKMSKNMMNRFTTQRRVFGSFNLISMAIYAVANRPFGKGLQKKVISAVSTRAKTYLISKIEVLIPGEGFWFSIIIADPNTQF